MGAVASRQVSPDVKLTTQGLGVGPPETGTVAYWAGHRLGRDTFRTVWPCWACSFLEDHGT